MAEVLEFTKIADVLELERVPHGGIAIQFFLYQEYQKTQDLLRVQ